jgi:hypothetical protein
MTTYNKIIKYMKDIQVGDCLLYANTTYIIIYKSELYAYSRKNKYFYIIKICDDKYGHETLIYDKYDKCTILPQKRMKINV